MSDAKLIILLGVMHLVALGAGGLLLAVALGGGQADEDSRDEGDGGGGGKQPPPAPRRPRGDWSGGPPLPDAMPAHVRLREAARLADRLPRPARRRPHKPQRVRVRGEAAGLQLPERRSVGLPERPNVDEARLPQLSRTSSARTTALL